jgi:hypothetical protein
MPLRRRVPRPAAKPYDAAMKELVGLDPAAWLTQQGVQPSGPVTTVPTDLSGTTLVEADHVLRVGGASPWLVQLEFQSSRDARLVQRLHLYSTLPDRRHRLAVQSVLALLRPQADARSLTGAYECSLPHGEPYLTFRYQVVRVWEQPLESLLSGPLTTLPLATLVGLSVEDMAAVLRRIEARVRQEAQPSTAERVRAASYLLLGLRFPQDVIDDLLRGVGIMAGALKESSTYQGLIREGEERALAPMRDMLIHLGSRHLGPPTEEIREALSRITDPEQLATLGRRILDAASWDEALMAKSAL